MTKTKTKTKTKKAQASWEHSSESNEHFTPAYIVNAEREVLGGQIDLDPASSPMGNLLIQATKIYTLEDPGHAAPWFGSVHLNPPGGSCDADFRQVIKKKGDVADCTITGACGLAPGHKHASVGSSAKRWWFKLAREWMAENVRVACFIGFSLEMLQTMQVDTPAGLPTPLDFPLCIPRTRIPYDKVVDGKVVSGKSPPHASFISFLYDRHDADSTWRFRKVFKEIGRVLG